MCRMAMLQAHGAAQVVERDLPESGTTQVVIAIKGVLKP
jgi:hypothetical protein